VNPEVLGEENVAVDEVRGGFRSWRRDQHEGAASLVPEFACGAEEAPAQVPLLAVRRVLILLAVPFPAPPQSPQDLMPPFGRSWENPNVARGEASMGAGVPGGCLSWCGHRSIFTGEVGGSWNSNDAKGAG
jgi:hypothetical protein